MPRDIVCRPSESANRVLNPYEYSFHSLQIQNCELGNSGKQSIRGITVPCGSGFPPEPEAAHMYLRRCAPMESREQQLCQRPQGSRRRTRHLTSPATCSGMLASTPVLLSPVTVIPSFENNRKDTVRILLYNIVRRQKIYKGYRYRYRTICTRYYCVLYSIEKHAAYDTVSV